MRLRPAHVIPMLVLFTAGCKVTSVTQPSSAPEVGSLEWSVQQAKAKGETKVELVNFGGMPDESNLEQTLEYSTIVAAVPISSAVQVQTDTIATWHKFKVLSVLSEAKKCGLPCNPAPNPPLSLLPLAHDEIAIPFEGGLWRWTVLRSPFPREGLTSETTRNTHCFWMDRRDQIRCFSWLAAVASGRLEPTSRARFITSRVSHRDCRRKSCHFEPNNSCANISKPLNRSPQPTNSE